MPLRRTCAPMPAKPQNTVESSRHAVSTATVGSSNRSRPLGPPAVASVSTAYVANSAENRMMSLIRKIQNP